jgi:hypothetical protein
MAVSIISLDGARIGLAEESGNGVGSTQWFLTNTNQSAAYALETGYSVETVEEIECGEVESLIGAIAGRLGVTMATAFVPFSQSRNAKPGAMGNDKPWQSLNWICTFTRFGRHFLTTDYAQGSGHAPASKASPATVGTWATRLNRSDSVARHTVLTWELENGVPGQSRIRRNQQRRLTGADHWRRSAIPRPRL